MNRNVGAPVLQCRLQFLDEQTLAAHVAQPSVAPQVAFGSDADQGHLDVVMMGLNQILDVIGLPQRQRAFARRN